MEELVSVSSGPLQATGLHKTDAAKTALVSGSLATIQQMIYAEVPQTIIYIPPSSDTMTSEDVS